jgi:hypothetical protein
MPRYCLKGKEWNNLAVASRSLTMTSETNGMCRMSSGSSSLRSCSPDRVSLSSLTLESNPFKAKLSHP